MVFTHLRPKNIVAVYKCQTGSIRHYYSCVRKYIYVYIVMNIRTGIFHYVWVNFGPAGGDNAKICSLRQNNKHKIISWLCAYNLNVSKQTNNTCNKV
jgi:hypothetical protein